MPQIYWNLVSLVMRCFHKRFELFSFIVSFNPRHHTCDNDCAVSVYDRPKFMGGWEMCRNRSYTSAGYICTRRKGHRGCHVACGGASEANHNISWWKTGGVPSRDK